VNSKCQCYDGYLQDLITTASVERKVNVEGETEDSAVASKTNGAPADPNDAGSGATASSSSSSAPPPPPSYDDAMRAKEASSPTQAPAAASTQTASAQGSQDGSDRAGNRANSGDSDFNPAAFIPNEVPSMSISSLGLMDVTVGLMSVGMAFCRKIGIAVCNYFSFA
jgi:hypothetical protein